MDCHVRHAGSPFFLNGICERVLDIVLFAYFRTYINKVSNLEKGEESMQKERETQLPGMVPLIRTAQDEILQDKILQDNIERKGITMEEYLAKRRLETQKSRFQEYPQDPLLLQMKAAEWPFA